MTHLKPPPGAGELLESALGGFLSRNALFETLFSRPGEINSLNHVRFSRTLLIANPAGFVTSVDLVLPANREQFFVAARFLVWDIDQRASDPSIDWGNWSFNLSHGGVDLTKPTTQIILGLLVTNPLTIQHLLTQISVSHQTGTTRLYTGICELPLMVKSEGNNPLRVQFTKTSAGGDTDIEVSGGIYFYSR